MNQNDNTVLIRGNSNVNIIGDANLVNKITKYEKIIRLLKSIILEQRKFIKAQNKIISSYTKE